MYRMMLLSELLRLKNVSKIVFVINFMLLSILYFISYNWQQPLLSGVSLFMLTTCFSIMATVIGSYQSGLLLRADNKTFLILRPQSLIEIYAVAVVAGVMSLLIALILPLLVMLAFSVEGDNVNLGDIAKALLKVTLIFLSCYFAGFLAKLHAKRIAVFVLSIPLILLLLSNHLPLSVESLLVLILVLCVAGAGSIKANDSKNIVTFHHRRALLLPVALVVFVISSLLVKLMLQMAIVTFDERYKGDWREYFPDNSYQRVEGKTPEELKQFLVKQFKNVELDGAKSLTKLKVVFPTFSPLPGTLRVVSQKQISPSQIEIAFVEGNLLLQQINNESLLGHQISEVQLGYKETDIKDITLYYDDNYSWVSVLLQEHQLWNGEPYLEFIQIENQSGNFTATKLNLPSSWSIEYLTSNFTLSPALLGVAGALNSVTYLTSTLSKINNNILLTTFIISLLCFLITWFLNKRKSIDLTEKRFWLLANSIVGVPALLTYLLLFSLQKQVAVQSGGLNE